MDDREIVQTLVQRFTQRAQEMFGQNLVSIVLYGSVARGDFTPTSDIDLLMIFEELPARRHERYALTRLLEEQVEESVPGNFSDAHWHGFGIIHKTRAEAQRTSVYYLDLTTDAILLYDRDGFFRGVLERLRARLRELCSQKVYLDDGHWYWVLKPDAALGEVIEI